MQKKEQGFTLIELLVTIGVLAIIASIATPSMTNFRKNQEISEQEKKVKLALSEARTEARLQNKPMKVVFSSSGEGAADTLYVDIDSNKYSFNMKDKNLTFYNNGLVDTGGKPRLCLRISDKKDASRFRVLELSKLGIVSKSTENCTET
ncbi:prepilin-type N-terminal cleavage/methylation domain-containing protein [Acinetobacter sp. ANC 5378]|uniref:pilus assembly FimT family protein n=1 Tax=Acinetobacter sp. ANC 5378 TaxID=2731249 RepID=UPI0014901895|nr:prepilin-type N-terminal cleavage/methylation domain-containing protein [Acinetobacter sp. ANC 5378]NNG81160.1 prepilin-type N-terminal cleavage/methylation domain-containing protein [Acinetobacter sp. ANC 5378]